jgi:uncharacterized protein
MQWYNEPPEWTQDGDTIKVTSGPKTDFWRKTHYGFIRDNGHIYSRPVTGNFEAEVKFSAQYTALYDHAGLMVRLDEITWLKCGVEYVHGVQCASAVVTRDYSDWSVVPLLQNPSAIWLRVKRVGDTVEVHYSLDRTAYTMIRTAYLTPAETVNVGIMCASPEGNGFTVVFEGFVVRPM